MYYLPVSGLLREAFCAGEGLVLLPLPLFGGARISWLRRALVRLPAREGGLPLDTGVGLDDEGVVFLPEDL